MRAPSDLLTPPGDITHVVVGYSSVLLPQLARVLCPGSVWVLEEPDIIDVREVAEQVRSMPVVGALTGAPTQAERDPERLAGLIGRPPGVRAVLPGVEYGVVAAACLAETWGLPGAGLTAARTLRDKALLRRCAATVGLAQPRWASATGPGDVAAFRNTHGGRCVLKPTGRQASIGVQLLSAADDVEAAWRACTGVDEWEMRSDRARDLVEHLVEERLDGPEVSVETLVGGGRVLFGNVTAKSVLAGAHPVETGHVLPAELPADIGERLQQCVRQLIAATGFGSGILHSEWILVGGSLPHLVECAARLPGDGITTLIDLAYGGSLVADLTRVLEGVAPVRSSRAGRVAAVQFFTGHGAGDVAAIHGVEQARRADGVAEVELEVSVGSRLEPVVSSMERPRHVIAVGSTAQEATARARAAVALIRLDVR